MKLVGCLFIDKMCVTIFVQLNFHLKGSTFSKKKLHINKKEGERECVGDYQHGSFTSFLLFCQKNCCCNDDLNFCSEKSNISKAASCAHEVVSLSSIT